MELIRKHSRTIHIGIIEIPQSLLLKLIQYPDGIIRSIDIPLDRADIIRIQLEHPEMPEAQSGYYVPAVEPYYHVHEDCLGHKVETRLVK